MCLTLACSFVVAAGPPGLKTTTSGTASPNRGKKEAKQAANRINVNFGRSPRKEEVPNPMIGGRHDAWTKIDVRTRKQVGLVFGNGDPSDVEMSLSANDGEWGLQNHHGVGHAYLYHNCRCVDLTAGFKYIPPGKYDVYVFAHGDAPNQNAAVEVHVGAKVHQGKATLNDGSYDFRQQKLVEGVQYVRYRIRVRAGDLVQVVSKRDGSDYAMLNAIQFQRK